MNNITFFTFLKNHTKSRTRYSILIIVLLIFIYFKLSEFFQVSPNSIDYPNLYMMFFYTIMIFCVLIFHAHKFNFYFDSLTLWLIVIGCLLRPTIFGELRIISSYYLSFLGIVFAVYIVSNQEQVKRPSYVSILVTIIWSTVTVVILSMIALSIVSLQNITLPSNLYAVLFVNFFSQLSSTAVIEEVIFRGIFVGFLIMNGVKEDTSFVIQAFFFWLLHFTQLNNVFLFFIFIPILTFSTTLIVKKYKMIYPAILVHTFVNTFVSLLVSFLSSL